MLFLKRNNKLLSCKNCEGKKYIRTMPVNVLSYRIAVSTQLEVLEMGGVDLSYTGLLHGLISKLVSLRRLVLIRCRLKRLPNRSVANYGISIECPLATLLDGFESNPRHKEVGPISFPDVSRNRHYTSDLHVISL